MRALDALATDRFNSTQDPLVRLQWARVATANLFLWLGWLRSMELFDLRWGDVEVLSPSDGPSRDLPFGVGAVFLTLKEETKTNRFVSADVVLGYRTITGYRPGFWFTTLLNTHRQLHGAPHPSQYLFTHPSGGVWDSYYFRHECVYPLLAQSWAAGDAYLTSLGGDPATSIPGAFYSLHMYRRGARTHCEIVREPTLNRRTATRPERYEHARWKLCQSGEEVDVIYREWHLLDRLAITLYCF